MAPEPELVFDEVADLYDRVRRGYPSALIDDAITLAAIALSARVLEIGSGTGKATEAFVRRGLRVVGIEAGASLARVARRRLAGTNARLYEEIGAMRSRTVRTVCAMNHSESKP